MNEFLAKVPFDLYELSLFHLAAKHGSFTRAGREAGLTQSAITRQIQGIEERLGIRLFERTTRRVTLTPAGKLLFDRAKIILQSTEATLADVQSQFGKLAQSLRVGVARSIGLAYYPGFFFAFGKRRPDIQLQVTQETTAEILVRLDEGTLDAGLLPVPERLPRGLVATHRFRDDFTLIGSPASVLASISPRSTQKKLRAALKTERWLMLDRQEIAGVALYQWLKTEGFCDEPAMELDSFDVILNLAALGLGIAAVPQRVLALYGNRKKIVRLPLKPKYSREIAVVVRKTNRSAKPLDDFVGSVLF
ncbi:MAG TPA: LysR family transcriptional regulator [Candidatus Limnocylindria bacterium]|jgi:DNA-binding transcriptional LysR family regulator|nr:LysR family transcriptional regulator [Candidatus Limnocylindria bacterium]